MTCPPWPILYEDNHLLVVVKPALLPTMGVAAERSSLIAQAKAYIKDKYQKPGNVYLGVVSRLDAPVSGLIVFARTSKAASRLTDQFRRGTVEKCYWAVVQGAIRPKGGNLLDFLRKDERHRRVHVVTAATAGAKEARLAYKTLQSLDVGTLIEVQPETGRKHQIRVQLSHAGHPILGDRKYGSRAEFPAGIALHSRRLVLEHPVRGETLTFAAPLPRSWENLGITQ